MWRFAVLVEKSFRAPLTDPSAPVPTVSFEVSFSMSGEIAMTAFSEESAANALTGSTIAPFVS
jgi:hypothetical protein